MTYKKKCYHCGTEIFSSRKYPLCKACNSDEAGPTGVCTYRDCRGVVIRCDELITDEILGLCKSHSRIAWEMLTQPRIYKPEVYGPAEPVCKRGHKVVKKNVWLRKTRGYFNCLACRRASETKPRRGPEFDPAAFANEFYARVMGVS